MAPGVNSNLVTTKVFLLKKTGVANHSGTHNEESCVEVSLVQIIEEIRGIRSRTIIICETPLIFLGAIGDISFACATTTSPPATRRVGRRLRVCRASTSNGNTNVWDCNAGITDFLNPLLDLRRIRGRCFVQRWIVTRREPGNW